MLEEAEAVALARIDHIEALPPLSGVLRIIDSRTHQATVRVVQMGRGHMPRQFRIQVADRDSERYHVGDEVLVFVEKVSDTPGVYDTFHRRVGCVEGAQLLPKASDTARGEIMQYLLAVSRHWPAASSGDSQQAAAARKAIEEHRLALIDSQYPETRSWALIGYPSLNLQTSSAMQVRILQALSDPDEGCRRTALDRLTIVDKPYETAVRHYFAAFPNDSAATRSLAYFRILEQKIELGIDDLSVEDEILITNCIAASPYSSVGFTVISDRDGDPHVTSGSGSVTGEHLMSIERFVRSHWQRVETPESLHSILLVLSLDDQQRLICQATCRQTRESLLHRDDKSAASTRTRITKWLGSILR